MAPKRAQEAAKKKAAKQKKILAVLLVGLLGALVFAFMTLSHSSSGAAPASVTPAASTTPADSTPIAAPPPAVTAGISAQPVTALHAFTGFGRKDPFHDDGPDTGSTCACASSDGASQSTPSDQTPIADQSSGSQMSSDPGVNAAVLKPSQVGSGYQMKVGAASNCVAGCTTMDLCGYDYKSEADRTARLQVNYVKTENDPVLSNEVVRYRSGGAALAMRELNEAVASCPRHPVSQGAGTSLTWRVHRITAPHLLSGAVALRVTVTGTKNGVHVGITGVAIYQVRGNLLSGVYEWLGANAAVATSFAVHAAQASAVNLTKAAH